MHQCRSKAKRVWDSAIWLAGLLIALMGFGAFGLLVGYGAKVTAEMILKGGPDGMFVVPFEADAEG